MFRFHEGACVAVKSDNLELGLSAGETGIVWALYDTQPPAYEVTFSPQSGSAFDALMYEDELADPAAPRGTALGGQERSPASV